MCGCPGSVPFIERATLCAPGYHVCTALEYMAKRGETVPRYHYWTANIPYLGPMTGAQTGACLIALNGLLPDNIHPQYTTCPTSPMRVCAPASPDDLGNTCEILNCGFEQPDPSQYFGGASPCTANGTAGALCCPPEQQIHAACNPNLTIASEEFASGKMVGCAGVVMVIEQKNLCASDYHVCTAQDWVDLRNGATPSYNYWTATDLGYAGQTGACQVVDCSQYVCCKTTCSGVPCTPDSVMRVCAEIQNDPLGNDCNWTGCGLSSTTNEYFGGCNYNFTAGALCCK